MMLIILAACIAGCETTPCDAAAVRQNIRTAVTTWERGHDSSFHLHDRLSISNDKLLILFAVEIVSHLRGSQHGLRGGAAELHLHEVA